MDTKSLVSVIGGRRALQAFVYVPPRRVAVPHASSSPLRLAIVYKMLDFKSRLHAHALHLFGKSLMSKCAVETRNASRGSKQQGLPCRQGGRAPFRSFRRSLSKADQGTLLTSYTRSYPCLFGMLMTSGSICDSNKEIPDTLRSTGEGSQRQMSQQTLHGIIAK